MSLDSNSRLNLANNLTCLGGVALMLGGAAAVTAGVLCGGHLWVILTGMTLGASGAGLLCLKAIHIQNLVRKIFAEKPWDPLENQRTQTPEPTAHRIIIPEKSKPIPIPGRKDKIDRTSENQENGGIFPEESDEIDVGAILGDRIDESEIKPRFDIKELESAIPVVNENGELI